MRKEYISPAIKLLVIDELCTTLRSGSVVSGESDVVIDGFGVVEDTSEKDDLWNADNWGGS